jgi:DNA-binding winged helix-turn-helix (wHTH) protein
MADSKPVRLSFDGFELDEANATLSRDGRTLSMPPKAFAVLCALARQPGSLLTKIALLDAVWGHRHVSESVLKTTVSELRAALSDDAKQPRYIETASRRGYRFIGAAAPAPPATPPSVAAPIGSPEAIPRIVGRSSELAKLRELWRRALAGQKQLVWIAGEPGVGKTTLIDTFLSELDPQSWVLGQCVERFGSGEPYMPVLDVLTSLCRRDAGFSRQLRELAPAWLLQLPSLCTESDRAALRGQLAGANQERMVRELRELMEAYSAEHPLLLVTEDLHWSDEASLHLMDHFVRRKGQARILWLGTFRLTEVVATDHPLKALRHELRLHKLCEEILLDPFSEQELAAYIGQRLPALPVSDSFVRSLHSHTDGLPLFVVNVVDDLLSQDKGGEELLAAVADASAPLQVPENLAGVIEKQIARLTPEQCRVLEAASVCGVEFRLPTVADALERELQWVSEHCEVLARRYHWIDILEVGRLADGTLDVRYAFRHALYRHVFYQRIGAATRAQWHHHIARSMERNRTSAGGIAISSVELAMHFESGRDLPAAVRHYGDAAESAISHFVPAEAVRLTTHALSLLSQCAEGIDRLELELSLQGRRGVACSQTLGAGSVEAEAAFARARALAEQLPPVPRRAFELGGAGVVHYVRGEYDKARAVASQIALLADARSDRILKFASTTLLGSVLAFQGELQQSVQMIRSALVQSREIGDEVSQILFVVNPLVVMNANLCMPLLLLGFADQAQQHKEAALAHARRIGQPMGLMLASWLAAQLDLRMGRGDSVMAHIETLEATVAAHQLPQGGGPASWLRGLMLARSGDPETGQRLIMDGYERHAAVGMLAGCTQVLGFAVEATILGRDWQAAESRIASAIEQAKRMGEYMNMPDLLMLKARIAEGRGDTAMARSQLQAAQEHAARRGALWQQLEAAVALCQLKDESAGDRKALKAVLAQITEGQDTRLLQIARSLSGARSAR